MDLKTTSGFLRRLWGLEEVDRPAFRMLGWNRQEYDCSADGDVDPRLGSGLCRQVSSALESLTYDDDGMPLLNSYTHIGVHASAFGCSIVREEGQEAKVLPVMRSASDAGDLRGPSEGGETELTLQYQLLLAEHCRPGWRVTHADLQGPTDTASLLWDYSDLLTSGYTDPDKVRDVLGRVTAFIVEFERRQIAQVPELNLNHNPGIWVPQDLGVSVSEDLLAVVGPDWYREFGMPYNDMLAEAFNGIFIHSCGCFTQNLPVLREHKLLRGVNFNLGEVEIEPLLDALAGRTVLVPRLALGDGEKLRRYVSYLREKGLDTTHHFYIVDNGGSFALEEAVAFLQGLGIAPGG